LIPTPPPSITVFLDSIAGAFFVFIVMQKQSAYNISALRGIAGMFISELISGLFMPLIVGIENGLDKGMTESDLQLTNGFGFGMLCIHASVGRIVDDEKREDFGVSVEEFRRRLLLVNELYRIYDVDAFANKMTIEFVEKMKDAGWSANVGTSSNRKFNNQFKKACASKMISAVDERLKKLTQDEEE